MFRLGFFASPAAIWSWRWSWLRTEGENIASHIQRQFRYQWRRKRLESWLPTRRKIFPCFQEYHYTVWRGQDFSNIWIRYGRGWVRLVGSTHCSKGPGVLESILLTTKIQNNAKNYQADNADDLDGCEDKLSLTICTWSILSGYVNWLDISNSPAPRKLMVTATKSVIVTQAAGLIVLFQNPMRTAAADNSAGRTIVQLYLKWFSHKLHLKTQKCYQ